MNLSLLKILGIDFFCGTLADSINFARKGGLIVAPSGPGLACDLKNSYYYEALRNADLVIPDSGFMCLWVNFFGKNKIKRISGYAFLKSFLDQFESFDSSFWIMPDEMQDISHRTWINESYGVKILDYQTYIAPTYERVKKINDEMLLGKIKKLKPNVIFIQIGGGIQESLGFFLKQKLNYNPSIICTGAALAFLSGEQAKIPKWADRFYLGWFIRCLQSPKVFVPRYFKAIRLAYLLLRFGSEFPGK